MRAIKFRAWDTKKQEWSETNTITDWINRWSNKSYIKRLEFMQFTGLLDKNGKEIYEGDMLGFPAEPDEIVAPPYVVGWHKERAEFECTYYYDRPSEKRHVKLYHALENKGEVIGNIYSNPELTP